MATWRKVIVSGSNAELSSLFVSNAVTASVVSASAGITGSLFGTSSWAFSASNAVNAQTASFVTASNVWGPYGASSVLSASHAVTAAFALNAAANQNLTFGSGLSGSASTYNGNTAVTVAVSGAATLTTDRLTKWTGTGFANSIISDNGTTATANGNLTVTGDLTVAGTASFTNANNLLIRDQFIAINSGSNTLQDAGFVVVAGTGMSGSAFYLEAGSTGDNGRFAVAPNLNPSASAATADEYMVTAKVDQGSAPGATTPSWGGNANNAQGNMWITSAGDIYIWA